MMCVFRVLSNETHAHVHTTFGNQFEWSLGIHILPAQSRFVSAGSMGHAEAYDNSTIVCYPYSVTLFISDDRIIYDRVEWLVDFRNMHANRVNAGQTIVGSPNKF